MIIKEQVTNHFNAGALSYEAVAQMQAQVAMELTARIPSTSVHSVLEIGCGTGLLSQYLPTLFPNATIWLTDIAPAMVKECTQRFMQQARIKTVCVDGECFSFATQFDLITSSMVLHWFTDISQALLHIRRQLMPGGYFVFSILGENSLHEWRDLCTENAVQWGTPVFPSPQILQDALPGLELSVVTYRETYPSAHAFLNVLKKLGATAPHAGYTALSAGKLRSVLRRFESKMTISYEVIYGSYRKS
jgi:malonyl-CoA O-methyltransferase